MANSGFDDFVRTLDKSTANFDMEAEKFIGRVSLKLLKRVKLKTPVDTGQLHNTWRINMPNKLAREVYNNCEYALSVEYGHRTRGGKGFVKGAYMLTKSVEEVEKELEADLQNFMDNLWR